MGVKGLQQPLFSWICFSKCNQPIIYSVLSGFVGCSRIAGMGEVALSGKYFQHPLAEFSRSAPGYYMLLRSEICDIHDCTSFTTIIDLLFHDQRLTNLFKIKAFLALVSLKPMSVSCLRMD